ncbi:uncharacterized protein [Leuresthes tenuis]|uniref:uncharacterized protein n=1 Tax=Leuresthes tenuis TaxID=355514 RepID=UPI003B511116
MVAFLLKAKDDCQTDKAQNMSSGHRKVVQMCWQYQVSVPGGAETSPLCVSFTSFKMSCLCSERLTPFTMLLPALLLLLVSCTQASHFYGTVMTYYPKDTFANGSVTVVLRYKLNFHSCSHSDTWSCSGNCGALIQSSLDKVDEESNGEWCHNEGLLTRLVPSNAPFQLLLDGNAWISNVQNINNWKAVTEVELRNRSDTGKANTSPLTTILPAVRVPSNCGRIFFLLAFDPDGDEVKCRFATGSECQTCTQPSVLNLFHAISASASFCLLLFNSTSSSNEGSYVVQMVMEDFPRQNITLTHTNGSQVTRTTSDAISKIPIQFAVKVDPAVPSCTEGHFLPKLLSPTPAHLAQLYTPVGQELEIPIRAEAVNSTISELLFSGPYDVDQTNLGSGNFSLRWTPSEQEDGESHPFCFVVQATEGSNTSSKKMGQGRVTTDHQSVTSGN